MSTFADALTVPFPITAEHQRFYAEEGYIKLKQVLPPAVLAYYAQEISRKVRELNTMDLPMEKRTTYQKAFLQIMNLWTKSEIVKEFVFAKRLAQIATDVMKVRGVRLYHDQALYKEAGGGVTPWHADQFYWPFDTNNTVTAWIPLQETPTELGPLALSAKSHRLQKGRDLEISDESEKKLREYLREEDYSYVEEPYELGEVSFHSGWTYHRAAANTTARPREVMTIIYVDQDARIAKPKNKSQEADLKGWLVGANPGEIPQDAANPVLFTRA